MKRILALLAMAALASLGVLSAQELVQVDAANPPFMFAQGGSPAGLYPAVVAEAFKRMGVKVTIAAVPWKRALADTDEGKAGTAGIYQNSDRLKKYDFSQPYYEERLAVYSPANKELKYSKIEDLFGKTVGVINGWSYGDDFDNAVKAGKIKAEATDGDAANMGKLGLGRLDAVLAIMESGDAAIKAQKLEASIKRASAFLSVSKVYLAFGKSANKIALLAQFDKAIESMKKDGSFDAIVAKSFQ